MGRLWDIWENGKVTGYMGKWEGYGIYGKMGKKNWKVMAYMGNGQVMRYMGENWQVWDIWDFKLVYVSLSKIGRFNFKLL